MTVAVITGAAGGGDDLGCDAATFGGGIGVAVDGAGVRGLGSESGRAGDLCVS